jgi:hypothetical protein
VGGVSDPRAEEIPHTPYANTLETALSQTEVSQILEVFERMGVSLFLERNPFSSLELSPTVIFEDREVGGLYDFEKKVACVALTKAEDEYGQEFVWGRISKLSAAATTSQDAVQRTLVHEFGHHIHRMIGDISPLNFVMIARAISSNGVSSYARRNGMEYFAESFSAYTFHRTEFIVHDQLGYDMIERALHVLGIEVTEQ